MSAGESSLAPADRLILEGLVTTFGDDGSVNVSPMGPLVDRKRTKFVLRPYKTSRTYQNLKRGSACVFHVTDNVLMIAEAITGRLKISADAYFLDDFGGPILKDACQWFSLRVVQLENEEDRTTISCEMMEHGSQRDFFGFNRAKHAVLEAAILATRTAFLPADFILGEIAKLQTPVDKTAGELESQAFQMLKAYILEKLKTANPRMEEN